MATYFDSWGHPSIPHRNFGYNFDVQLLLSYQLIAAPLSQDAMVYNSKFKKLFIQWWGDIGGPNYTSQVADPDTDYNLICDPRARFNYEGKQSEARPVESMLPGVISLYCLGYVYPHDTHRHFYQWGFNWLVAKRRPITPRDIFIPNSGWLNAIIADAHKERAFIPLKGIDYADRHHWLLGSMGLGYLYGHDELPSGAINNQAIYFALIPWSKLRPYLNPHGIVPKADWKATLPTPAT